MDAMAALARDQRSKVSRLRWGRSGPATYAGEWKVRANWIVCVWFLLQPREYLRPGSLGQ